MAKIGDIVRYLNDVGGGRVVRIDGNMAWVDDDGFETPVLLRECVVVRTAEQIAATEQSMPKAETAAVKPKATQSTSPKQPTPAPQPEPEVEVDTTELPGNDKLNIVLGFEPTDRSRLTDSDFDATLINDSNYYLYFNLASRDDDSVQWTSRYAGLVEPNTELWLGTFERADVALFDSLCIDYIAFKKDKAYLSKSPASVAVKVDTTKFFKLHCYRSNPYFDNEVLAFTLVENDIPANRQTVNVEALRSLNKKAKPAPVAERKPAKTKPAKAKTHPTNSNEPLVVDLHIDELLDTTAGMSSADILNYQIDTFRKIMDENLRNFGRTIVFIHGKGDGVLRHAITKELDHRYKGHEYSDASFSEYGYGATKVVIRQNIKKIPRR